MKKTSIMCWAVIFTVASNPIATAQQQQQKTSTSFLKQITRRAGESFRTLRDNFQKNRQAARDARLRQQQLKDITAKTNEMRRANNGRLKTNQQLLNDRMRQNQDSQDSNAARQKDMQRMQKDRLSNLKNKSQFNRK